MILSPHHQNRIRNLGMSAVYRIAADEGVSPSDVLDLMVAAPFTPSQPEVSSQAHAPAADTPASQAAGVMTDGDRSSSSSLAPSPSVDPSPQPARRRPGSVKAQVFEAHDAHPDWTAQQIADHYGLKKGSVATALFDARKARNATLAVEEPVPAPNPQKPVGEPPPPASGTLLDRVRIIHQQHPTFTARLIANELGANQSSVSVYLATIRKEEAGETVKVVPALPPANTLPNQPAGSIEARLKADAAARRARLGGRP